MMAHLQDRNMQLYITYCSILHSDTIWQIVVFLTACICEYTHNYLHCIIDLTQRGWHTLRRGILFDILYLILFWDLNNMYLEPEDSQHDRNM